MRVIRIDASAATILLTEAPAPKVRDRQTGEIAKDAPWESVFNGQQRHGIAYRATAVTPGAFPMAQAGLAARPTPGTPIRPRTGPQSAFRSRWPGCWPRTPRPWTPAA